MNKKANNKIVSVNLPKKGPQNLPLNKAMQMTASWIKQGQFPAAINTLKQITTQLPSYSFAWAALFDALEKLGDFIALEKASLDCLSKKSRFIPALMSLAIAKQMQLKQEEALEIIKKAIKLKPRNAEIHNILGIIYKELGQTENALEAFNKCIKINPKHTSAIWNKSDIDNAISEEEFHKIHALAESKQLSDRDKAKLLLRPFTLPAFILNP